MGQATTQATDEAAAADRVARGRAASNLHWARRLLSESIALVPDDRQFRHELGRADQLIRAGAERVSE